MLKNGACPLLYSPESEAVESEGAQQTRRKTLLRTYVDSLLGE